MQRILSSEITLHVDEKVQVAGWIHRRRELKSVAFLILRDRAGLAQIVVSEPATRDQLRVLPEETVVEVIGVVSANPSAPGGVEIIDPHLEPLTEPAAAAPFDLFRPELTASLPTILDYAPVALRHPSLRQAAVLSAQAVAGFRSTLDGLGFTAIHTPKIV